MFGGSCNNMGDCAGNAMGDCAAALRGVPKFTVFPLVQTWPRHLRV